MNYTTEPSDRDSVLAALDYIDPNCEREDWWPIGSALKSWNPGAFDIFDSWSQGGNYNSADTRDTWKSLTPGHHSLGTLFRRAVDNGWTYPNPAPSHTPRPQPTPETHPHLDSIWEAATCAIPDHDYLIAKKIGPNNFRMSPDRPGLLLIDVRDATGMLVAIQTIAANGGKRYVKGSKPTRGSHIIGNLAEAKTIYITEGVATAHSVKDLTPFCAVISAMSVGSLHGPIEQFPQFRSKMIVAADNDEAGLKGARAIFDKYGVPWSAPHGSGDWNDLYCRDMDQVEFRRQLINNIFLGSALAEAQNYCKLYEEKATTEEPTATETEYFHRLSKLISPRCG